MLVELVTQGSSNSVNFLVKKEQNEVDSWWTTFPTNFVIKNSFLRKIPNLKERERVEGKA